MRAEVRYYKLDFVYSVKEKRLFELLEAIARRQKRIERKLEKVLKKMEK